MTEVRVDFGHLSHWDALLPISFEQMDEDDHDYARRQCEEALDREKSQDYWRKAAEADPSIYGDSEADKEAFLAEEFKAMDRRSRAWAQQAVSLRASLNLRPVRVAADGACGLSSLSVAGGGTASHDEREFLRRAVLAAAPKIFEDVRFQKLLFILEGDPAHVEASGQQPALGQSLLGGSACEGAAPADPDGRALDTSQAVAATATLDSDWVMVARNICVVLDEPHSVGDACGGDTTTSSDKPAVANATGAEAETLEVGTAPPVAVATASVPASDGNDIPDASQIPRPQYPWRGGAKPQPQTDDEGARAQPQTGDGGAKAESPILEQTRSSSRSRSRSLSRSHGASQLSQATLPTASGPPLENPAFGISFGGVKRRRPEDNRDPVREHIERLRTVGSATEFLEAIWPRDLFNGMENENKIYTYVQDELDKIHNDHRNHREISQDPSFTTSMVAPVPLNKATRQIALKHGIHAETLLLAVASNINWLEHHWTRVGAEPPPDGINVIERHVGQKAWKEAMTTAQSQEVPDPEAWAKAWKETVAPGQSQVG